MYCVNKFLLQMSYKTHPRLWWHHFNIQDPWNRTKANREGSHKDQKADLSVVKILNLFSSKF